MSFNNRISMLNERRKVKKCKKRDEIARKAELRWKKSSIDSNFDDIFLEDSCDAIIYPSSSCDQDIRQLIDELVDKK